MVATEEIVSGSNVVKEAFLLCAFRMSYPLFIFVYFNFNKEAFFYSPCLYNMSVSEQWADNYMELA